MIISSTFYFKNVRWALEKGAKENDGIADCMTADENWWEIKIDKNEIIHTDGQS